MSILLQVVTSRILSNLTGTSLLHRPAPNSNMIDKQQPKTPSTTYINIDTMDEVEDGTNSTSCNRIHVQLEAEPAGVAENVPAGSTSTTADTNEDEDVNDAGTSTNNNDDDDDSDSDDDSSTSSSSSSSASTVSSSSAASSAASSHSMSSLVSDASESSSSGSILSSASEGDLNDDHDHDHDDDAGSNDHDFLGDRDVDARMRRKFAARDKTLKRIARDNKGNKKYVEFLKRNEREVRAEAMRILDDKRRRRKRQQGEMKKTQGAQKGESFVADETAANDAPTSMPRTIFGIPTMLMLRKPQQGIGPYPDSATSKDGAPMSSPSTTDNGPAKSIVRLLCFEFYHTIPGLATLVLYCLAHLSIYELLNNVFLEATKYTENQRLVYTATFGVCLFLSRLTGGIWGWVKDDTYAAVKFDMHNRLRLRELDARILRWFRRHSVIKCVVDIIALYLCFMTVSYFLQYGVIPTILDARDEVLNSLPSSSHDFCKTRLQEILGDGISVSCSNIDLSEYKDENACFDDSNTIVEGGPYCYDSVELAEALTEEDEQYVLSKISVSSYYAFIGDGRAALTRPGSLILFFATTTLLSIGALFWCFEFQFWDL